MIERSAVRKRYMIVNANAYTSGYVNNHHPLRLLYQLSYTFPWFNKQHCEHNYYTIRYDTFNKSLFLIPSE